MEIAQNHYVYEWVRPDYNVVFYVGKGSGDRAWNFLRNDHTDKIIKKLARCGLSPSVRIVARFLTKERAFDFEVERIAFWEPLGELANKTLGGDSGPRMFGNDNPMADPVVRARHYEKAPRGESHPCFGKPAHNRGKSQPQTAGELNPMNDPSIRAKQKEKVPRGDAHSMKRPEVRAKQTEVQSRPDVRLKRSGERNGMNQPGVREKHLDVMRSTEVKTKQMNNTPRGSGHYMKDPARKAAALAKAALTKRTKEPSNG